MLFVIPRVELGLGGGIDVHRRDQQTLGLVRSNGVSGHQLIPGEAQDAAGDVGDALRPDGGVLIADRLVFRAVQNVVVGQVVGCDGNFRMLDAEPALRVEETGDAQTFRNMFQIVPIVELIGLRLAVIERDQQNTLGHGSLPCCGDDGVQVCRRSQLSTGSVRFVFTLRAPRRRPPTSNPFIGLSRGRPKAATRALTSPDPTRTLRAPCAS